MKLLSIPILLFCCFLSFGQENNVTQTIERSESIKPLRLGARFGVPSLITVNAEYVTPLLDNRVAATLDYINLSKSVDGVTIKYSNFEFGTNVYLQNTGKGLYASLTYFSFKSIGAFEDIEFDDSSTGPGEAQIDFSTINFKVGVKFGRIFYFRAEVGYGLGKVPEQVVVKSDNSDATSSEDIPKLPGVSSSGVLIYNIGIGFSFL